NNSTDVTPDEINLLTKILTWPNKRISALDALNNNYFDDVRDEIERKYPAPAIKYYKCGESLVNEQVPFKNSLPKHIRNVLYDWLEDVVITFKFTVETIALAFILMDQFSSLKQVQQSEYQKYGCVCV